MIDISLEAKKTSYSSSDIIPVFCIVTFIRYLCWTFAFNNHYKMMVIICAS